MTCIMQIWDVTYNEKVGINENWKVACDNESCTILINVRCGDPFLALFY